MELGGRPGISSLHLIQSALARPSSGYHRPLSSKCAALLQSLVGNHGFIDGNKRTAWICVEILIERSGYRLAIPDDEPIDDLVVDAASGQIGYDALQSWFKDRLRRVERP
ncbi:death-on-curing protein [Frigidibacter albus]|nr:death-on-curing protein [Frigidibacter albus]